MRLLLLVALVLLIPTSLAAEDDLAAHLRGGGQIVVRLSETGGAHASATTEGEPEEDRTETSSATWDSAWAWNMTASLGSANGRLVGVPTFERSIRATSTSTELFESYAGAELAVRQETTSRCEMTEPTRAAQAGITGRVDEARGVLVLEVTGITSTLIPADAWSPCESRTATYSWTDGTEETTQQERGPSELALSAHSVAPRKAGAGTVVLEVPLAAGETELPARHAFEAGTSRGFCDGDWPADACVVEGVMLAHIEKGPGRPTGVSSAASDGDLDGDGAASADAGAQGDEEGASAGTGAGTGAGAGGQGTPFPGLPGLAMVAVTAAVLGRRP